MVHDLNVHGRAQFTFTVNIVMQDMLGQAHKQGDDQCTV